MEKPERAIKEQFEKIFVKKDWLTFKKLAEYYLRQAANLKKRDIDIEDKNKLWVRNVQKRLFLGIACELLLKSAYLYKDYIINKPRDRTMYNLVNYKSNEISKTELIKEETFAFNQLLDNFQHVLNLKSKTVFEKGFRIAKVFRNKEGHTAILKHQFIESNYQDIEAALIILYSDVFNLNLDYKISFKNNEQGKLIIKKLKFQQAIL